MKHRVAGRKLSRSTGHRRGPYRDPGNELIRYGKDGNNRGKGKEVCSLAEKMITLGKQGTLHSRRQALTFILDKNVVDKVFDEISPRYAEKTGGYTRLTKLGPRRGDGAPMAHLELV